MREQIKDNMNRIIGTIEDRGNIKVVLDSLGRKLGEYNKSSKKTYDVLGRIKSEGDTLTNFLY
jgi:hypothetical protein